MAGSHHVKLRRPDRSYCFEAWAYPSHPLSRIPLIGPYFTFNLGRNPKFVIKVKYLGYEDQDEASGYDSTMMPVPEDRVLWDLDIGMKVGGEYVEGGDETRVDLALTTLTKKTQRYVTRKWPLSREGQAELSVEHAQEEPVYSFKVKDISADMTLAIFTIVGVIVGALVTLLVTS